MSTLAPFWYGRWITSLTEPMKTTKIRADMDTRNRIDTVRDNRFGAARPSIRETLHILVEEELDRLEADDE
jgi:hypothetical protein